jgi:hypothetical protein
VIYGKKSPGFIVYCRLFIAYAVRLSGAKYAGQEV